MNCSKVVELISQYIDGMLEGHTRRVVETHLKECPDCRREVHLLRSLVAAAGQVTSLDPPRNLKSRIMQSVGELQASTARCRQTRRLFSAYLDSEVSSADGRLVARHLASCKRCAADMERLRMLVSEAGRIESLEPPEDLRERIAAATTQRRTNAVILWLRGLATARAGHYAAGTAAAASLVFALFINFGQTPNEIKRPGIVHVIQERPADVAVAPKPSTEPVVPSAGTEPLVAVPTLLKAPLPQMDPGAAEAVMGDDAERSVPMPEVPQVPVERAEEKVAVRAPVIERVEQAEPEPEPVAPPPMREAAAKPRRDPLVEVALTAPAVGSDNAEWIRQMRTSPAMHSQAPGKSEVGRIDAP